MPLAGRRLPTPARAAPQLAQRPGAGRRHLGRNVPFAETRDYVKKVLANTTNYAALLTGQPQSLRSRLGTDGATRCSVAGGERRLALRGQRRARNGGRH